MPPSIEARQPEESKSAVQVNKAHLAFQSKIMFKTVIDLSPSPKRKAIMLHTETKEDLCLNT
eukprot:12425654-Karenia_brevis.AAC.1